MVPVSDQVKTFFFFFFKVKKSHKTHEYALFQKPTHSTNIVLVKGKSGWLTPEGFSYPVLPRPHHGTAGQPLLKLNTGCLKQKHSIPLHLMPSGHTGLTQTRCWCCSPCPSKEHNLGQEPELVGFPKAPLAIPLENRLL